MMRNDASIRREQIIERQTALHDGRIDRLQSDFLKFIVASFIDGLPTNDEGLLTNGPFAMFLPSRIDEAFDKFSSDNIEPVFAKMQTGIGQLLKANKAYFGDAASDEQHEQVSNSILSSLGIVGGAATVGSLLYTILADREAISTIKGVLMSAITGGMTIAALRTIVEEVVMKQDGGIFRKIFNRTIGDPFVKVARAIGNGYSAKLGLDHAIYQGGIIKTSRPFCIERNNRVFTREEISKFGTASDRYGGYESPGEFQGKTPNYNPFVDCGGYNCRHQLDWISPELAKALRPDLN